MEKDRLYPLVLLGVSLIPFLGTIGAFVVGLIWMMVDPTIRSDVTKLWLGRIGVFAVVGVILGAWTVSGSLIMPLVLQMIDSSGGLSSAAVCCNGIFTLGLGLVLAVFWIWMALQWFQNRVEPIPVLDDLAAQIQAFI